MIDFGTLFFMKSLDNLAALSANGIKPFSAATAENRHEYIFYNETYSKNDIGFPVVLDACIDDIHHDIVGYYDDGNYGNDYTIAVVFDDDHNPYVEVRPGKRNTSSSDWLIVLEDGHWYFC